MNSFAYEWTPRQPVLTQRGEGWPLSALFDFGKVIVRLRETGLFRRPPSNRAWRAIRRRSAVDAGLQAIRGRCAVPTSTRHPLRRDQHAALAEFHTKARCVGKREFAFLGKRLAYEQ